MVEALESRCLLSVTLNEFPIPTASSRPTVITSGPDGNLWFSESGSDKIGQINPTTHAIAEFSTPTLNSDPIGITTGPDGNLWFTEANGNKIGEINPATHAFNEFSIPTVAGFPSGITSGPDGNLWFTEFTNNQIGQINPTTHAIAEFPIPTTSSEPEGITAGPDGNLWFTEFGRDKIGQINPTTHAFAEFPIPTAGAVPYGITSGPDGNLWFTESAPPVDKIGMINPTTHAIAESPIPTANSFPFGITSGPDGNLWFTEEFGNKIAQVAPSAPVTGPDLTISGTAPNLVSLGSNVTYTLTVTNNGTAAATGVTLADTLPAGVTFVSATGGATPESGALTFPLGNLAAGATASVTIVVTSPAAGTLTNQARFSSNQADPTPADDSITQLTTVGRATGPVVTSVRRFGFHARPTLLVLTFDRPLNPERAQDPGNYQIVALGGSRRNIRVGAAVYDAAARTVTLSPVRRLNLHDLFRLTVNGTAPGGLTDASGNLLDGQNNGDPGSNFVTIVSAADLVLTTTSPAILREYRKIVSRQSSILSAAGLNRTL